jgi:cellulose synthase/poly-beta-1,6-N-acetylglucosamine synthase-like glycosyltransferase
VTATLITLFVLLGLAQVGQCWFITRYLRQVRTEPLADADCPPALVVLCLRGGDPFLHRSLQHLATQDYPRFRVRIMVDSPQDTAHQTLRDLWGNAPPAHVEIRSLTQRFDTCTFKMSGILAATADLTTETTVVALMDGDTVPHPTWLRELAAPIARGTATVVTGNRWFFPETPSLGSLCRFWWNAAAVPQMTLYRMPWGGTMAVRRELIQDDRLRDRIRHACSEDTSIGQFAHEQALSVHFEPSLLIVNREEIGLRSFFEFETRQLLFTRLEIYCYWPMVLFGLMSLTFVIYPAARLCGLAVSGWVDAAFAAYFLASWGGVLRLGLNVRSVLARRGEKLGGWSAGRWWYSILAVFVLPVLHFAAIVRAAMMRRVRWRGVWYRISSRPRVQVERDEWTTTA